MRVKLVFLTVLLLMFLFLSYPVSSAKIEPKQWVSIPVFGPTVNDILCKSGSRNIVYITISGELFKTINGGLSWELVYLPPSSEGKIRTLAEEPASEAIYVGVDEGLLKSIDGGKNWINLSAEILKNVSWIKVIDSKELYVLSNGKLYKTINGGKSWGNITPPTDVKFIAVDPKSKAIYTMNDPIVEANDIFYSNDGGLTWQKKFSKEEYSYTGKNIMR